MRWEAPLPICRHHGFVELRYSTRFDDLNIRYVPALVIHDEAVARHPVLPGRRQLRLHAFHRQPLRFVRRMSAHFESYWNNYRRRRVGAEAPAPQRRDGRVVEYL